MLNVQIKSYDESSDTFTCSFQDSLFGQFESTLPATILPYIAPELVSLTEDLPFGLVGGSFTMSSPAP
jgi:hypothetical protein